MSNFILSFCIIKRGIDRQAEAPLKRNAERNMHESPFVRGPHIKMTLRQMSLSERLGISYEIYQQLIHSERQNLFLGFSVRMRKHAACILSNGEGITQRKHLTEPSKSAVLKVDMRRW